MEIKPGMKFEYEGNAYEVLNVRVSFSLVSGLYVMAELKHGDGSNWYGLAEIGAAYAAGNIKILAA